MFVISAPGMPSTTIRGPSPALLDEIPRTWMLPWLLGSARAVLVTVTPETFPCRSILVSMLLT